MWLRQHKNYIAIICKVLVFALILGAVMWKSNDVLGLQDDTYTTYGYKQFYELPKDSVDVVTLGSSGMREFFNVNEAYNFTGIAAATLATSGQPFYTTKYLIKEVEKTQHPKVYVIDIRQLEFTGATSYMPDLRRVADSMRFSKNRLDLINRAFELDEYAGSDPGGNKLDYIFSYFLYHSRWDELTERDFGNYSDVSWMAFSIFSSISPRDEAPDPLSRYEAEPLTELHQIELDEVLAYCKELHESRGTEFLFIDSLSWPEDIHCQRGVEARNQIEAAGFSFVDTREWFDAMGFDLSTDFRDSMHVNVWGSFKYTDYLADYLQQTYDLADHRGDDTYSVWQENYDGFIAAFQALEAERAAQAAEAEGD